MRHASVFQMIPRPMSGLFFRKADEERLRGTAHNVDIREAHKKKKREFLHCHQCKHIITAKDLKVEVAGNFEHTFRNPAGVVYRIGCFSKAPGCLFVGEPTFEFTWFPGYSWVYSICQNCHTHLGWTFQSGDHRFYGLILKHLTSSSE